MNFHQKKLTPLPRLILSAALVLGVGLLLSACSAAQFGRAQAEPTSLPAVTGGGVLTAEGWISPLRSTALGFVASGELGEILVREGQAVQQGDVLARLGERETLEAALALARLEQLSAQQALNSLLDSAGLLRTQSAQALVAAQKTLIEAKKALNLVDTRTFQDRLDDRSDAVEDAKEELDTDQEKLDKYQDLDPENSTRKNAQNNYDDALHAYRDALYNRDALQNQLDQARAAVDLAQAALDDAQRVHDANLDGPDPDALALAQARLDNANAQVAAARTALEKVELTAPYASTVVDINDLEPGEYMTPGKLVVILADESRWMVETRDLTELDVVNVEVGQKVSVTPDALPEVELVGVVESIDRLFTERSGDILYTVHIRLDGMDARLRWGMTVTITFK